MNSYKIVLVTFCALISVNVSGIAGSEEFLVSRNIPFTNSDPDIAVNTSTGDVLVVWQQKNYDQEERKDKIYAALCKRKKDGTYKVGKARLLSNNNALNDAPKVAYSSSGNCYLVVWDSLRITTGSRITNVEDRVLSAKGRLKGSVVSVVDSKTNNDMQANVVALNSKSSVASPSGQFMILWLRSPKIEADVSKFGGFWSLAVDVTGHGVAAEQMVMKANPSNSPHSVAFATVCRLITRPDGSIYMGCVLEKFVNNDKSEEAYIVKLDSAGKFQKKLFLSDTNEPIDARLAVLSDKLILTNWYAFRGGSCVNQLVKLKKLTKMKSNYEPLSEEAYTSELLSLPGGGALQLVNGSKNNFLIHYNSKGKMVGQPKSLPSVTGLLSHFSAQLIPGTNNIFLVQKYTTGSNTAEIRGRIIVF